MSSKTAILFFPDAVADRTEQPLMLAPMLFCPVLTWVGQTLAAQGVERFFAVCDRWQEELLAALPAGAEAVSLQNYASELPKRVDEQEELIVLSGPVVPAGFYSGGSAFTCTGAGLHRLLAEQGALTAFPSDAKTLTGFVPFGDEEELQELTMVCRDTIVKTHIQNGVRFLDANAVYIDPRVTIGRGTLVLPGTILRGSTAIGCGCEIGPNTMLTDCTVGDGTSVNASQGSESAIGSNTSVGPFAYIRPHCRVGDKVRVGDFVELKNSNIGNGTKISHLTYVGDSDVGERVNFGCGTVTTNYDGFRKYRTTIEDDCFIGCNTNFIAPVKAGRGCYIAAGSTVTGDIPADALAVARARQVNLDGWAARNREKKKK